MKLEREKVVRTALEVLNREGLEGLTLRKLAAELDVQAPALYWHFRNKQALLDEMATTILRDQLATLPPGDPGGTWQEWITGFAHGMRAMLRQYRDGARMFSGTKLTDRAAYAPMERWLERLVGAGLSLEDAVMAGQLINAYTIGFLIEEQAVFPKPDKRDPDYDLERRNARVGREEFPLAHDAGELSFEHYDERFARGIAIVVAGMTATFSLVPGSTPVTID